MYLLVLLTHPWRPPANPSEHLFPLLLPLTPPLRQGGMRQFDCERLVTSPKSTPHTSKGAGVPPLSPTFDPTGGLKGGYGAKWNESIDAIGQIWGLIGWLGGLYGTVGCLQGTYRGYVEA